MNEHLKERELWWPVSSELMASYRDGDKPAWIGADGSMEWLKNGRFHRDDDKPAILNERRLEWYKNDKLHRDGDKPAEIGADGILGWRKNGLPHRITGPAVIYPNNKHEYWINGVNITKEVESWLETRQYTCPFTPEQQVELTLTFS
jgi:hypothetical protein